MVGLASCVTPTTHPTQRPDIGTSRYSPAVGRWVLAGTILGSSMAFIDGSVINVALPVMQKDLQATVADTQWIVESYALFLASLILVGGSLGDRLGRRRIFAAGIILFTIASIWCGIAPDPGQLILARAVQGVGGALFVPGSLAIITATFPIRRAREGHRYMGRSDHHRHAGGAGAGRLAGRIPVLALGILHQCAHSGGSADYCGPQISREPGQGQPAAARLAGRRAGNRGPGRASVRLDRVGQPWIGRSARAGQPGSRRAGSCGVCSGGGAQQVANDAAEHVQIAHFQRRQHPDLLPVRSVDRGALLRAVRPSTGARLQPHRGGCCVAPFHHPSRCAFEMVGRAGFALRPKIAACGWARNRGDGFRSLRAAGRRGPITGRGSSLPWLCSAWAWRSRWLPLPRR